MENPSNKYFSKCSNCLILCCNFLKYTNMSSFSPRQQSFTSYAVEQDQQRKPICKIKLMLLGAKSVGKSRMLESYTHQKKPIYQKQHVQYNKNEMTYHTQGIDFVSKVQQMNGIEYHLHIWDTADFNQFIKNRTFFHSLSDDALGFLIVYDVTKKETFDLANVIYNEIRGDPKRKVYLVGTNSDIALKDPSRRQVKQETANNYGFTRNITVRQINASSYAEVESLFKQLLEKVIQSKGATVKRGPKLSGLMNPDGFQKRYNRCC